MDYETFTSFGEKNIEAKLKEDDMLSTVQFSPSGQYAAAGDSSGRIITFRINSPSSVNYLSQIVGHKSEFDYLRSELSEPRVNSIKWIPKSSLQPLFLSCNMHEAKLWRLAQSPKQEWNQLKLSGPIDNWILPNLKTYELKYTIENVKKFVDGDTEYAFSIEVLYDQTSFFLADIGCVKLFDINRNVPSVTIFQTSSYQSELSSTAISPSLPYGLLLGDNAGAINLLDTRQQSSNLTVSTSIDTTEIFKESDIIGGCQYISSITFIKENLQFAARSYNYLSIWDLRNPAEAVASLKLFDCSTNQELIKENGSYRDSFNVKQLPNGDLVTGIYGQDYVEWDFHNGIINKESIGIKRFGDVNLSRKVTYIDIHPKQNILGVASSECLFFQKI